MRTEGCTLTARPLVGDAPWNKRTLYLQIPREAPGVAFMGEWEPMGRRATVSRDTRFANVLVPDDGELLPTGMFGALYLASSHGPFAFGARD